MWMRKRWFLKTLQIKIRVLKHFNYQAAKNKFTEYKLRKLNFLGKRENTENYRGSVKTKGSTFLLKN